MKIKQTLLPILSGCFILLSCGSNETNTSEKIDEIDSTVTTPTNKEEEQESTPKLAFDGIDKGEYTLYGHSEIEADGEALSREDMFKALETEGSFNGKVRVNIDEVCQKAGCWITFENGEDQPVRVFFRDHFTIPTNTPAGTEAILLGQLVADTLTIDFQKHLLDDAKEAGNEIEQAKYDAITEDKIETTFDCESILIKK